MTYTSKNIRDIAILGHLGTGKTTLTEALAYASGAIKQKGEVEKKNTNKINLIDLPGNDDFVGEILSVTRLIKGAILVIDASAKVQVGTVKHWNILRKRNIPTIIYVNKMDKENVNFEEILSDIREKLGKNAIPFCYPIGHEENFDGFVNVVDLKARRYNGKECVDDEIYPDKKAKIFELHNTICEAVATTNESLLDKFFGGEELTRDEIHKGLREGVLNGELIPVLVGSATKNIGIHTLLSMLIDYLPSPADLKPYKATDNNGNEIERKTIDEEPFSAYVFKTIVDPYAGTLNVIKVNSGILKVGDDIWVSGTPGDAYLALMLRTGEWSGVCSEHAARAMDNPTPRIALGQFLEGRASACADISDGFLKDLGNILSRSNVGARINVDALAASDDLNSRPLEQKRMAQLAGGDDYELVWTAPVCMRAEISAYAKQCPALCFSRVGEVTPSGLMLFDDKGREVKNIYHGFDHFSQ